MGQRVDDLLAALTLDEKCGLTAGHGLWSTRSVPRVGLPPVRLTDGPNGARGPVPPGMTALASLCVPCGTALGATWDMGLVEEIGAIVGDEALAKGSRVLLAPTVNIHRSPIAGRNFECHSEDPLLSGLIASAYIRGAQSRGVVCTVKHFVGNEAEFERATTSSEIDERTLREIYLRPFELAVQEGRVLGVMTAYNRVNGIWCAEHGELIRDILRDDWGFGGFVVSDWRAVGSTRASIEAGLDLEMPGPGAYLGEHLLEAVRSGDVDVAMVDAAARRLLSVLDQVGALDEDPAEPATVERPERRIVARRAAAGSMVLLRNEGLLPIDLSAVARVAVIGPNAESPTQMGGGSASLRPHHRVSIVDALRQRCPDVAIRFEPGVAYADRAPVLPIPLTVEVRTEPDADPIAELQYPDTEVVFPDGPPGAAGEAHYLRGTGRFRIQQAGTYTFTLVQISRTTVSIDGTVVVDGVVNAPLPGLLPWAPQPLVADVELIEGEHELLIESSGDRTTSGGHALTGFTVGCRAAVANDGIERAAAAAAAADLALVVVGTDAGWETEGVDRPDMDLPGAQNELVARVCAAQANTIVVLNTGSPVALPWAEHVPALLQAWFGGQEIADALVDVLVGDAEPGGRLPTTFPLRLEHNPSFGTFPGENGVLRYGEGVFVGYRWYDSRGIDVAFPFGHGLTYTTFQIGVPHTVEAVGLDVVVTVPVANTGKRRGSEVVQCYVAPPKVGPPRPARELRAFARLTLDPGQVGEVTLRLDRRAFARWDPALAGFDRVHAQLDAIPSVDARPSGPSAGRWVVDDGLYELCIGRSVADIAHRLPLEIQQGVAVVRSRPVG